MTQTSTMKKPQRAVIQRTLVMTSPTFELSHDSLISMISMVLSHHDKAITGMNNIFWFPVVST